MAKSVFREKEHQPDIAELEQALGAAAPLWASFVERLEAAVPAAQAEWKYYGKAWGWCLVYREKKRTLAYCTPGEGQWVASFVFSEAERAAARGAGFAPDVLALVEAGQHNTAGHTFDIEVETADDLAVAQALLAIRLGK